MSEQETSELRSRIEASLRTRYGTSRVAIEVQEHGVTQWRAVARLHGDALGDVVRSRVSDTEADALAALAFAAGLNDDESDPRVEVERLRRELAEARAALRDYAPRCGACRSPLATREIDDGRVWRLRCDACAAGTPGPDVAHADALRVATVTP